MYKNDSVVRKYFFKYVDEKKVSGEKFVRMNENMSLYDLKNAISYYTRVPKSLFRIYTSTKKTLLDSSYDTIKIRDASNVLLTLV